MDDNTVVVTVPFNRNWLIKEREERIIEKILRLFFKVPIITPINLFSERIPYRLLISPKERNEKASLFFKLPDEMMGKIFDFLSTDDRYLMSTSCSHFRLLTNDNRRFIYLVAKAAEKAIERIWFRNLIKFNEKKYIHDI